MSRTTSVPTRLAARAAGVACLSFLLAPITAAQTAGPRSADAMAFIRVIGDVQVRFTSPWMQEIAEEDVEVGTGSGFVIAPSGLILTNHHVVSGETVIARIQGEEARVTTTVKRVEVVVGSGGARETFEPRVAADDAELDLVVLQVTAPDLPYVPFGDSDASEPGRQVKILGFPFGRKVEVGKRSRPDVVPEATVTAGSLSASRSDEKGQTRYLQTDASMNPGSSGGPMVDEEGYALGVVRMKLSAGGRTASGAGFGVPINLVKDFLDSHGLLSLMPATRLRPGVVHGLDWKGIRVELPDGFADASPARLRVDTGDAGSITVRVDRVATPWNLVALEETLLQGKTPVGFLPAAAVRRSGRGTSSGVVGSARGTTPDGQPFRVEYALLDLKHEKVLARYLGPPDELAFNLGLVQRSLEKLEADPLLVDEVRAPLRVTFETVPYPAVAAGMALAPMGWSREPATHASCRHVPSADAGLALSPPGDFTVVFRALRWVRPGIAPDELARACGQAASSTGGTYARRFERLGVALGVWGTFVSRGEELVLLEAEAPEGKLPFVRDAFASWVRRVADRE
jgi:S1-C subfamily serine protease